MLHNSAKFTKEGGAIDLRVDVIAAATAEAPADVEAPAPPAARRLLRIQVVDTGIGIEPGAAARVPLLPAAAG